MPGIFYAKRAFNQHRNHVNNAEEASPHFVCLFSLLLCHSVSIPYPVPFFFLFFFSSNCCSVNVAWQFCVQIEKIVIHFP